MQALQTALPGGAVNAIEVCQLEAPEIAAHLSGNDVLWAEFLTKTTTADIKRPLR